MIDIAYTCAIGFAGIGILAVLIAIYDRFSETFNSLAAWLAIGAMSIGSVVGATFIVGGILYWTGAGVRYIGGF